MSWYYERGNRLWLSHGGHETIAQFEKTFSNELDRQEHIAWASSLSLYFEDDEFVYTHAGLNPYEPLDSQSRDVLWNNESYFLLDSKGGSSHLH